LLSLALLAADSARCKLGIKINFLGLVFLEVGYLLENKWENLLVSLKIQPFGTKGNPII
jgi:hypothetical protein